MQRFLRREGQQTRDVSKQLGIWNIVGNHLIPLIIAERKNMDIVFEAGTLIFFILSWRTLIPSVKLLVMLTFPVDDCIEKEKVEEYMQCYKEAFLQQVSPCHDSVLLSSSHTQDVLTILMSFLSQPLRLLVDECDLFSLSRSLSLCVCGHGCVMCEKVHRGNRLNMGD